MFISSWPISANPSSTSPPTAKQQLEQARRRGWTPPPRITVPQWADRYRKLAKEAGSSSGNWRTSTVEIARGAMLAVTEPGVHTISAMVCTQLMKTALLENTFGYFAHLNPRPMLLVQPKEDAAEQFSKERITPLIKATPVLRNLIGTRKTRSAEETLLFKSFPGGFLALAGAGSPDNLARRPVAVVMYDEVDKHPTTREGDSITIGDERMATFPDGLSIRACSPTIEGESRIESSYLEGDQRQASVECPHCRHRMFPDFFAHVDWQKTETGEHLTRTAKIYCEACGAAWEEGQRLRGLQTIRWHQTRPFSCCGRRHDPLADYAKAWADGDEDPVGRTWDWWEGDRWAVYRAKCPDCSAWAVPNEHASFTASKLYSPWPKDAPHRIAAKWIAAKDDPDKRVAFDNTQLGRPHKLTSGKDIQVEALAARVETWPGEVPDGVGVITWGGDVQDDRVELEFVGWGRNEESWSLDYQVVHGDPATPEFWAEVDRQLLRRFRRADGREFVAEAGCVDTGGHHTQTVYEFAKARLGRKVWAIKGASERNGQRSPVWPTTVPSKRNKAKFRPVIIGVNAAKDMIRSRLSFEEPGPGYMHFPADRDLGYFQQLTAERLVTKTISGRRYRVWELPSGRANEALDCRVYAYAALKGLLHKGFKLNRRVEEVRDGPIALPPATSDEPAETSATPKARRKVNKLTGRARGSFLQRRR
jgi:phage terminase large subunit GpA-like protein